MFMQNLQEKRELVAVYNELCSTLLGVQVTLSQNKPISMTAQDRHAAAACFQNSMQVLTHHQLLGSPAMFKHTPNSATFWCRRPAMTCHLRALCGAPTCDGEARCGGAEY